MTQEENAMQVNNPPTVQERFHNQQVLFSRCIAHLRTEGRDPDENNNLDRLIIRTINNLAALHTHLSRLDGLERVIKLLQENTA